MKCELCFKVWASPRFFYLLILICFQDVFIRNTSSHMINIAGILYYTCSLVIDIQCTRYRNTFNNVFNEFCFKKTPRSIPEEKIQQYVMWSTSVYASI